MSRINIAMNEIGKSNVVPEDKYLVQIVEGTKDAKSKEGNPMLQICVKIIEGEYAGHRINPQYVSLLPHARFLFDEIVLAAGVPYDDDGVDTDDFIGKEMVVDLVIDEYQGRESNKIKRAYAIGADD